jgi:hypothetical protein
MNEHSKDVLALFRVGQKPVLRTMFGDISVESGQVVEGDEWKSHGLSNGEHVQFLGLVKSAGEVADIVRKDPSARYILFRGRTVPIKVSMPVFIDGRNHKAFDAEFLP